MFRAWRGEFLCLLAAGIVLLLLGLVVGHLELLLGTGLTAYIAWNLVNLVLLQRWIAHDYRFRLPVSFGIWEAIFDGLQRRQLRNRGRRRGLIRHLRAFRDAGNRLPDALVLLGEDNGVLWFNAAAGKFLALHRPHDIGRDVTDLIKHPALKDALAGAGPGRPLELAAPGNGAWMLRIRTTGSFGADRGRMLIARDITPFYRVDQVRRDFIANVSHELRTPITVFRGYLGSLQGNAETSKWDLPLSLMDGQARRMQDLVDDLLLLSRLEMTRPGQPADLVPVPEMLETILEQAQTLSGEKGHELALEADPAILLLGDKGELRSAFSNLVYNAVRHTPPGTRIAVSWEGSPDHACLTVRDFGPGIAAHHLPRLTERFYRVDESRSREDGGTGLGLAIVKHVLERHEAELSIASELGQGSVFSCHFPGTLVDIQQTMVPAKEVV